MVGADGRYAQFASMARNSMRRVHQSRRGMAIRLAYCALAWWTLLLNIGNPTGLVLCIEDDGAVNIETPAEQHACQQRHELASAAAPASPSGRIAKSVGCVDIPLSFAPGAVLHRSAGVRPSASARFDDVESASCDTLDRGGTAVGKAFLDRLGQAGPSLALAARRTVVLLV
jgi:hypothetical protein